MGLDIVTTGGGRGGGAPSVNKRMHGRRRRGVARKVLVFVFLPHFLGSSTEKQDVGTREGAGSTPIKYLLIVGAV